MPLQLVNARQAVRNALLPTDEEVARAIPQAARSPGTGPDRQNVDPTKPFTYNPPSGGWPAGTESWAAPPSSPTGIAEPMQPPEGYVPPAPAPTPGEAPPVTGVPKTSEEGKQVAGQWYRINAAQGGRTMPADFTNLTSDDVNAALSKGPMEQAFTTCRPPADLDRKRPKRSA